jgi:hypothetical protein
MRSFPIFSIQLFFATIAVAITLQTPGLVRGHGSFQDREYRALQMGGSQKVNHTSSAHLDPFPLCPRPAVNNHRQIGTALKNLLQDIFPGTLARGPVAENGIEAIIDSQGIVQIPQIWDSLHNRVFAENPLENSRFCRIVAHQENIRVGVHFSTLEDEIEKPGALGEVN